jgi:16S rRNA processing protein RimM
MLRVVGNISGFHGVRGEIKIFPLVDDLELFKTFTSLFIDSKSYTPVSIRFHKEFVLVCFKDIVSLDQAKNLSGYVSAELDEELLDNEFYISDLIGIKVFDQANKEIGVVTNYSKIGQKLVFVRLFEDFKAKGDLLVPFVEEYIISVNPTEKKLQINLSEELLELCL